MPHGLSVRATPRSRAPKTAPRTGLGAVATALALAFAVASTSSFAHAGTVQTDVEQAEQAYANLEYPEANKLAERVVRQRGLSHEQLVRTYRLLALTYAVLDKESQAKDAFVALLTYDPDYQVDANLGPRVQSPFFEARGFWRAQPGKPSLEATTLLRPREAGTLRVTLRDPTHVARKVTVGYRWGSGELVTRSFTPGEAIAVDVPASPAGTSRLDYFAQAVDDRENVVFEVGTPSAPKSAVVAADEARTSTPAKAEGGSIFTSPVFWIVTGVVVAGGVTAAVLIATKPDDRIETRPATTGNLSPVLVCGGTTLCF